MNAYKGFLVHRPAMEKKRNQDLQTLLTTLNGKSGSKRNRLIPKLNQLGRNFKEFKSMTHNNLIGDALLDLNI